MLLSLRVQSSAILEPRLGAALDALTLLLLGVGMGVGVGASTWHCDGIAGAFVVSFVFNHLASALRLLLDDFCLTKANSFCNLFCVQRPFSRFQAAIMVGFIRIH